MELSSNKDVTTAARPGQPATPRPTGRRRRPSGAPPPLPRHVRRSGLGWLLALIVLMALSIALFGDRWRGPAVTVTVVDDTIVRWLSEVSVPGFRAAMRGLAAVTWFPLITAALWSPVVALIVLRRLRHLVVFLLAWTVGAFTFNLVLTAARRPRPFGVDFRVEWFGWALPSLAVTTFSALAVSVQYTLVPEGRWRNVGKWVATVLIGLVAVARMALAWMHRPTCWSVSTSG